MKLFQYPFLAMASECALLLYAETEAQAEQAADAAIAEVWRIEKNYSRYLDDNLLAAINRAAAEGASIELDAETAALVEYAGACYRMSDGLFDVTSGILREAWDFSAGAAPTQQEIDMLLPRIGFDKLSWQSPQLGFGVAGMELDFGGIGKEYAVDRAADICMAQGIVSGLLEFGGDIRVLGPHPDGTPWQVGIRHPRSDGAAIGVVRVSSGALATSGDYERFLKLDGQRYSHILDPHTGWPVPGLTSVSVLGSQCMVAGSLATIAMLKGGAGPNWLEQLGTVHCWVDSEMRSGGNLQFD